MQTLAAGAQAYQLADSVGKVADALKSNNGQQGAVLLSVETGFGFKSASKEQNQHYRQSQQSSKGNTVLNGAQAHARRIDADVGGTLYIESPQDTVEQESKQSGGGIRAQVALGTAWSVSGNYNQSKASGYSRSVGSQSGLFAGEGGYHIKADSVRLKGGAIALLGISNKFTAENLFFRKIILNKLYLVSLTHTVIALQMPL